MSIFGYSDYRSYLKSVLHEKTERNPSFSLRAFAKQMELSPSAVSRIFKGDKTLSFDRAILVAKRLKLSVDETAYFSLLVQLEQTKKAEVKAEILERLRVQKAQRGGGTEVFDLSVDFFKLISDWFHLSILEMLSLSDPSMHALKPEKVAAYLGIRIQEAEVAIERLKRLELIELESATGLYRRIKNRLLISSKVPNEAMRKYYQQSLEKASDALSTQDSQERISGSEVFALDPKNLEEARALTDQYLNQLQNLARKGKSRTKLYQAVVQVTRVNQEKGPKNESK